ncbi:MAG: YtxH domain-containing protein [Chloroflexota bacterium]
MRIGSRPATTADDISGSVKTFIDKVLEADITDTVAQRSRELAAAVGDATESAMDRASDTWRDSAPVRHEAIKNMQRASRDAGRWGNRAWRKDLQPRVRDLWKRRAVALGAAGAAIPAGRELAESAAERLGLKQREERHWGAFFLGLLLGAAGGVVVALLTTPKRGSELREELVERAQDVAGVVTEKAQAVAESAGDWVPLFQRDGVEGTDVVPADGPSGTAATGWPATDADIDAALGDIDVAADTYDNGTDAAAEVASDVGEAGDEMIDAVAQEVDEREGL